MIGSLIGTDFLTTHGVQQKPSQSQSLSGGETRPFSGRAWMVMTASTIFMAQTCMHAQGPPLPHDYAPCDLPKISDLCFHATLLPGCPGRHGQDLLLNPIDRRRLVSYPNAPLTDILYPRNGHRSERI